jgi:N-acetylglucosamine-6-phosphate deacetylase
VSHHLQVFFNGKVITDSDVIVDGIVVAKGGRIESAGPRQGELPAGAELIDAGGHYISPGFIDIHIHGGGGSDFMDANATDVEQVFRYHAEHGTTAMCPSTATAPLDEILAALDGINVYRSRQPSARALGAHIEGPYLSFTKRGCHLPEHVRTPEEAEWKQILERGPVAWMTLAPELPGAPPLIEALRKSGANPSAGHSEALYHEMEEAVALGVNHVTHLYCAMTDAMNNRWRGTPNPRAAGILEAVYLDERLTSEIITDGKHLSREMIILAMRNKGYEKLALITDAMRGAGMPDGEYTFGPRHGMVAHVRNREARIPDGTALASSVYAMNEIVATMVELTNCPLWQAVRMASLTPAEIVHVDDELGSLAPGKRADIILFDENVDVSRVFVDGRELNRAQIAAG